MSCTRFVVWEKSIIMIFFFFFQAEDGIRDGHVTGVQTCALPILPLTGHAQTKPSAQGPDITGSWERYGFVPGQRGGGPRDPTIPPPATQPALKPEFLKEQQARVQ